MDFDVYYSWTVKIPVVTFSWTSIDFNFVVIMYTTNLVMVNILLIPCLDWWLTKTVKNAQTNKHVSTVGSQIITDSCKICIYT